MLYSLEYWHCEMQILVHTLLFFLFFQTFKMNAIHLFIIKKTWGNNCFYNECWCAPEESLVYLQHEF